MSTLCFKKMEIEDQYENMNEAMVNGCPLSTIGYEHGYCEYFTNVYEHHLISTTTF